MPLGQMRGCLYHRILLNLDKNWDKSVLFDLLEYIVYNITYLNNVYYLIIAWEPVWNYVLFIMLEIVLFEHH